MSSAKSMADSDNQTQPDPIEDLMLLVIYKLGGGRERRPVPKVEINAELERLLVEYGSPEAALSAERPIVRAQFRQQ